MGNKKKAATHGLSKKERKALEEKAARLEAEVERREKKAAKKALKNSDRVIAEMKAEKKAAKKKAAKKGKKSKGPKVGEVVATMDGGEATVVEAPAIADAKAERKRKRDEAKAAAGNGEAVYVGGPVPAEEREASEENAAAQNAALDAEIRARVLAKREARAAEPGSPERLAEMQANVTRGRAEREAARAESALENGTVAEAVEAIGQAIEVVETEHGREFSAGSSVAADVDFAKPSEAPRGDFEVNGNGQYKVKRPSDGKMVGYTRVTTYIDAIEETGRLTAWKMRMLLEGVAAADGEEAREGVTARIRDLAHVRDVAFAKAHKADAKGKLEAGELAQRTTAATKAFRDAMDALADELLEVGGARDKANKGTDLHALFEIVDDPARALPAIHAMHSRDEITASDVRDCIAYADAIARLGAKIIDVERVIVNDAVPVPRFLPLEEYGGKPPKTIGVAGRLDRTAMVRLPGEVRGRRRVLDVKTGSIEYSAGKIARQLDMYANAKGYDLETHEREELGLDKKVALVVHVPAGSGTAAVYAVDLTLGHKGNKVAADVRAMRNEGKRAIDLGANLLDALDAEAAEG